MAIFSPKYKTYAAYERDHKGDTSNYAKKVRRLHKQHPDWTLAQIDGKAPRNTVDLSKNTNWQNIATNDENRNRLAIKTLNYMKANGWDFDKAYTVAKANSTGVKTTKADVRNILAGSLKMKTVKTGSKTVVSAGKTKQVPLFTRRLAAVSNDNIVRQMPIIEVGGTVQPVRVRGSKQSTLLGRYMYAVGEFARTRDPALLAPFVGKTVTDVDGNTLMLETNAARLTQLANSNQLVITFVVSD